LAISRHASPRGGFLFEIRFPKRAHWQINRGGFYRNDLNSNDHFGRPSLFMAMNQKLRNQKTAITPTAIPASTKNHNFTLK
jgi:hypothetical protein